MEIAQNASCDRVNISLWTPPSPQRQSRRLLGGQLAGADRPIRPQYCVFDPRCGALLHIGNANLGSCDGGVPSGFSDLSACHHDQAVFLRLQMQLHWVGYSFAAHEGPRNNYLRGRAGPGRDRQPYQVRL